MDNLVKESSEIIIFLSGAGLSTTPALPPKVFVLKLSEQKRFGNLFLKKQVSIVPIPNAEWRTIPDVVIKANFGLRAAFVSSVLVLSGMVIVKLKRNFYLNQQECFCYLVLKKGGPSRRVRDWNDEARVFQNPGFKAFLPCFQGQKPSQRKRSRGKPGLLESVLF